MLIRVDPQSAEPIFEQIVFQVKGAVARGELVVGEKLPSVRELAREVAVNPNTVARAYELLARDAVIVRRRGSGCFVKAGAGGGDAATRRGALDALMERAVTEAFHLGSRPKEMREALKRALDALKFARKGA